MFVRRLMISAQWRGGGDLVGPRVGGGLVPVAWQRVREDGMRDTAGRECVGVGQGRYMPAYQE